MKRTTLSLPLFALFLAISSLFLGTSAQAAKLLRGDWQSAGSPMPPPTPPNFSYRYSCQAEITDRVLRQGDGTSVSRGQAYYLYAVAKLEFSNSQRVWPVAETEPEWIWVARLRDELDLEKQDLVLPKAPRNAFSLVGNSVNLNFRSYSSNLSEPSFDFVATVGLPVNGYIVRETERAVLLRSSETGSVRATAFVSRLDPNREPSTLERNLFVACDKRE